ncbi:MAG: sugar transferase [Actinomycetota bacterium]
MNSTVADPPRNEIGEDERDQLVDTGPRSLTADVAGRPPWRVVIGAVLLAGIAAALGAQGAVVAEMLKEEVWVATGSIEIRDGRVMPESAKVVLESPGTWHPIAEREGISDETFQKFYSVDVAGGTQIVDIAYEATDRAMARRIVDDVLDTYIARFSAPEEVLQTERLEDHLEALRELEASLMVSLDDADDLPRLQQIDLQNELVRTRQQITTVIFRLDTRATDLLERRNVDPRIATRAFILEEPVTPAPLRAAVFGFLIGGLVGVIAIYLVFHRDTQRRGLAGSSADWADTDTTGFVEPPVTDRSTGPAGTRSGMIMKRLLDISLSGGVLLLASPLLVAIAVAIKATSRGPVLFRQERVGKDDQPFEILKFRTMRVDNDDAEHRAFIESQLGGSAGTEDGRFKLADPRVTAVGGPLRRFSLDELPQLWNVLRGDMSLVGPRPALPWETELFEARFRERTRAVPGCTGLWQVSGRSQVSVRRMLELDLEYVRNRSLVKDLAILIKTPLVVVRGDGAR